VVTFALILCQNTNLKTPSVLNLFHLLSSVKGRSLLEKI
jgi:hypothetical protein